MEPPHLPVALGVLYCDPAEAFERHDGSAADDRQRSRGERADLAELLRDGYTWRVSGKS